MRQILILIIIITCKFSYAQLVTPNKVECRVFYGNPAKIEIFWDDNSSGETGFNVYKTEASSPDSFLKINSSPLVNSSSNGRMSFVDTHVAYGKEYLYYIEVYNTTSSMKSSNKKVFLKVFWPMPSSYDMLNSFADVVPGNAFFFHEGIDILVNSTTASIKEDVVAARGGIVKVSYFPGIGKGLVIEVVNELGTLEYDMYLHLDNDGLSFGIGDVILPGQKIGIIDKALYTPEMGHLHFTVFNLFNPTYNGISPFGKNCINPFTIFKQNSERDPQLKAPELLNETSLKCPYEVIEHPGGGYSHTNPQPKGATLASKVHLKKSGSSNKMMSSSSLFGDVSIISQAFDKMNSKGVFSSLKYPREHYQGIHSLGYWIESMNSSNGVSNYKLCKLDNDWFKDNNNRITDGFDCALVDNNNMGLLYSKTSTQSSPTYFNKHYIVTNASTNSGKLSDIRYADEGVITSLKKHSTINGCKVKYQGKLWSVVSDNLSGSVRTITVNNPSESNKTIEVNTSTNVVKFDGNNVLLPNSAISVRNYTYNKRSEFWGTRAHKDFSGVKANGSDYTKLALNNDQAKFKDGKYHIHIVMKDLVNPSVDDGSTEVIIDNFRPYIKKLELLSVKDGIETPFYCSEWSIEPSSTKLSNKSIEQVKQLALLGQDILVRVTPSETLKELKLYTNILKTPKDGSFQPIVNDPVIMTKKDDFGLLYEATIHADYIHAISTEDIGIEFVGKDMSGNELEKFTDKTSEMTVPIQMYKYITNSSGTAIEEVEWIPITNPGKDICHKFRIGNCNGATGKQKCVNYEFLMNNSFNKDLYINTGTSVEFRNFSNGTHESVEWKIGEGITRSDKLKFTHTFTQEGNYNIDFKVKVNGENQVVSKVVHVVNCNTDAFAANFDISSINSTKFNFEDKSVGGAIKWTWDFGDGKIVKEKSPIHEYLSGDTYDVKLKVEGCDVSKEIVKPLNILPAYIKELVITEDETQQSLVFKREYVNGVLKLSRSGAKTFRGTKSYTVKAISSLPLKSLELDLAFNTIRYNYISLYKRNIVVDVNSELKRTVWVFNIPEGKILANKVSTIKLKGIDYNDKLILNRNHSLPEFEIGDKWENIDPLRGVNIYDIMVNDNDVLIDVKMINNCNNMHLNLKNLTNDKLIYKILEKGEDYVGPTRTLYANGRTWYSTERDWFRLEVYKEDGTVLYNKIFERKNE